MSESPAQVMRQLLVDLELCTDVADDDDWPVFDSNEPDSPDNAVAVYDVAGITLGRIHRSGEVCEQKGFMIRVRGTDQPAAWSKADDIKTALDESVHNTQVIIGDNTYTVYAVLRHSGPISVGKEPDTSRFVFTINAVAAMRQTN